ncbi:pyrimidine-specific ribonucleoside hydrolase RihA [Lactiplantibacillus plantarum]|uniref:pyrimidine-specific ribonucleoside hydrolase RihA n=1 Tax=Lactobacillaceae TaxID=33958 RepID=UPI001427A614|nr:MULTISPECIES: pyrimidine-specific ribonucleoside hydrolase RihA [Lactobacillaceae]MCH7259259.1 pyrimidine-specific ribonucleoside hydrolase RihA [Lactiplantibacillus sp. ME-2]MBP5834076.1 pyrimidine-specific ribonucleoside hydrolase RihA [Lactiplantibacillus plantarum]MBS0938871.1 pyrimidine-specific ribonucleoside hydrolase RihA [Lactiplantibacillus plantarum]MBU7469712.1 pyrimidine-specific ribonucleoside hydrolase RihA [Lactiplantibacillus plantarum]MBW4801031.1 pyrimidine-specific ribon
MLEDIILDCDPGHDDAVALMIAIASKDINLLAVTTSAGNQRHSQTLRNAMSLLTLMKRQDIPVASGNTKPLMRSLISGVSMHGVTGLDGADLPSPDFFSQGIPAIELIAKILTDHPQKVTLVVTGPCTNIALFLSVHPELRSRIKQIVILGGGMGLGNWGPTTEFNIQVDPEAAKIVLDSGIPIILAPLNVAFEAQLLPNEIEKIHNIDNSVAQTISGLMDFYGISFGRQRWGFKGLPLYDPCTVAWLIDPSKFTSKRCNVEVETKGELTTGETVIDYYHITNRKPNAEVLFHIDRQWFADLTISSIKSFDF